MAKAEAIGNLFRFMLMFGINRFSLLETTEASIRARVGWPVEPGSLLGEDDEFQDIEWEVQYFDNIDDAIEISEFLIDRCLIDIDRITVSEKELGQKIGWETIRYRGALDTLLRIKVGMLDDGVKSDYFFVHF